MKMAHVAAVSVLLFVFPGPAEAEELSAPAIEARIAHDGAQTVVKQLMAGSKDAWNRVLGHIKSGRDEWLNVARHIQPGVDAATGEDLDYAMAVALKNNAESVLKLVGTEFRISNICDIPLIEPTDAQIKRWRTDVLAALSRVRDKALDGKKQACREEIAKIK